MGARGIRVATLIGLGAWRDQGPDPDGILGQGDQGRNPDQLLGLGAIRVTTLIGFWVGILRVTTLIKEQAKSALAQVWPQSVPKTRFRASFADVFSRLSKMRF